MTRAGAVLAVVVVAVGSACTGARGSRAAAPQAQTQAQARTGAETQAPGHGEATMEAKCPMAVPGTQVAASDTPDGEAITFTTASPEQVDELRRRVHAMADMHDEHMAMHDDASPMHGDADRMHGDADQMHGDAGRMHDDMGPSGMSGMGSAGTGEPGAPAMAMPPQSRAVAEDVPGGVRVTVTPNDPADLERLRSAIRSHAEQMRDTGACGMGAPAQHPQSR